MVWRCIVFHMIANYMKKCCIQELCLWYSCTDWSYLWFSGLFCILVFFLPQKLGQKLLNEKWLNWSSWLCSFLQSNINFLIIKKHQIERRRKTEVFLFHVLAHIWFIIIGERAETVQESDMQVYFFFFPLRLLCLLVFFFFFFNLNTYLYYWLLTSHISYRNFSTREECWSL